MADKIYITIGYYVIALEERLKWGPPDPNPKTKGNYLIPFIFTMLGLSTIVVLLRLYTRLFVVYKFGLDDIFILPAYLSVIGITVGQYISLHNGWGVHVWDFDVTKWARMITIGGYIVQISMSFCCLFTKLSILLSYLRFSPPGLRRWIQGSMIFITVWTLGLMIPLIVACNPPHLYWDYFIRPPDVAAKCQSPYTIRAIQYTVIALNIFSDVLVMVLPIPTILGLQMPVRQKISVIAVFLIWLLATIAACLRFWVTVEVFQSYDSSYQGYDLWLYVALEAHLAVICACAPGLKPLIARTQIWPKFGQIFTGYRKKVSFGSSDVKSGDAIELHVGPRSPRVSRRMEPDVENNAGQLSESEVQLYRPNNSPTPSSQPNQVSIRPVMAHMQPAYQRPRRSLEALREDLETAAGRRQPFPTRQTNLSPPQVTKPRERNLPPLLYDSPPPAYPSWTPPDLRDSVTPQVDPYSSHNSLSSWNGKFSFSYTVSTDIDIAPIRGGHI